MLLVSNKSGAPVVLVGNTSVTVPASPAPPAQGGAVNVTVALAGLTPQQYIDLEAQRTAVPLRFIWTGDVEFATGTLKVEETHTEFEVSDLATLASLQDAVINDGTEVLVKTLGQYFRLDKASAIQADGITVITAVTGRWLRGTAPSPKWEAQVNWYVDPVGGNDENVGDSDVVDHPVKTCAEVCRRLSMMKAGKNYTLNLLNDVPIIDRWRPNGFYDQNAEDFPGGVGESGFEQVFDMTLKGKRTYAAASAFTAAAAVSVGNVQANFTDAVPTVPLVVGDMIEILLDSTGGNPLNGATAWIGKDLGGGLYRVSDWRTSAGGISATPPGATSTYRKVTLTKFHPPIIRMPSQGRLLVANVDMPSPGLAPAERGLISLRYSSITFNTCRISKFFDCSYGANSGQGGCCFFYPAVSDYAAGAGQGLANKTVVVVSPAAGIASTGCLFINAEARFWSTSQSWLNSCYFEESLITTRLHTNYTTYGFFAFTPAHTSGGIINVLGNGIRSYDWVLNAANANAAVLIDDGALVRVAPGTNIGGTHATPATPVGVLVRNGGKLLIASTVTPTITGPGGDLMLEAGALSTPPLVGGAVVPPLAPLTTWGNWAAAPFNRYALDYGTGSSIASMSP